MGTNTWVGAYDLAVDNKGNTYITGFIMGTAKFGSTPLSTPYICKRWSKYTTVCKYDRDVYVAKLDTKGNFLWATQAGINGYSKNDVGFGIGLDSAGNAYVTGYFTDGAAFGSTTLTAGSGSNNAYVAKLDTKGNFLWVVPCGAPAGYDIAVDSSGTSNIVGQFKGTTTFGKHSLTASSATTFVARLSNAGTFLWATAAPGLTRNSIALDGSGNTYLQGPGKLARLDNNGKLLWTKTLCSFTGTTPYGRAVALDSAGNAYISGQYWKSATCGATVLGSSGGVYIVKVSTVT